MAKKGARMPPPVALTAEQIAHLVAAIDRAWHRSQLRPALLARECIPRANWKSVKLWMAEDTQAHDAIRRHNLLRNAIYLAQASDDEVEATRKAELHGRKERADAELRTGVAEDLVRLRGGGAKTVNQAVQLARAAKLLRSEDAMSATAADDQRLAALLRRMTEPVADPDDEPTDEPDTEDKDKPDGG